jgi:hypothetical protein
MLPWTTLTFRKFAITFASARKNFRYICGTTPLHIVSSYVLQCIVISLKDMFYEHADSLVGICRDVPSMYMEMETMYPCILLTCLSGRRAR